MFNVPIANWWAGLLSTGAVALLAACFIVQLREWNIRPLFAASRWLRRPWLERGLLLFLVCGLVQYAATKGTGNANPQSDPEAEDNADAEIEIEPSGDDNLQEDAAFTVTNLCFTGISVLSNGVALRVAWPTNFFASGTTLDFFAKHHSLTNDWQWFADYQALPGATNLSVLADCIDDLGCNTNPPILFFKVQDRTTCAATMVDSDGDGLPDVYEFHHGTNPWIADAALASKTVVTSATDFAEALAASEAYDVIELADGDYGFSQTISIPTHPVLVAGSPAANVVIRSTASPAAFMLAGGQTSRTLFRDFRLVLDATDRLQVGFWCGGNLPWEGTAASATFENVHIRMPHEESTYYGWLFYRWQNDPAMLSRCSVNAAGAQGFVCGIYANNSQPIDVASCSFLNFPTNQDSGVARGLSLAETWLVSSSAETNETSVSLSDTLFDASFAAAAPIVREASATNYVVAATNCLTPSGFLAGHEPDVTNACVVGEPDVTWCGVPTTSSLAVAQGVGAFSPIAADSGIDTDGDGLSDYDEAYDLGTDPWLSDSDFDGVDDATEVSQGTDPTDEFSFRCSLIVSVTNETVYANATNYVAWGLSPTGWETNALGIVVGTGGTLTNIVAYSRGGLYAKCYCDLNANGVYDEAWDLLKVVEVPRRLASTITFAFQDGDSDKDGMPDVWEWHHGLCMTNAADAFLDADSDGLINLHEFWAGCDPQTPDGSNTVLSVMARSVDDRLSTNLTRTCIYSNYSFEGVTNGLVKNPSSWAYDIDLSSASPWNGWDSRFEAGTLITRRHVLFAKHYLFYLGEGDRKIYFRTHSGGCHVSTIIATRTIPGVDFIVAILDADVSDTVSIAKILPDDFEQYIATGVGLPLLSLNQNEEALVRELVGKSLAKGYVVTESSKIDNTLRYLQAKSIISGDSGNPQFLLIGTTPILVSTFQGIQGTQAMGPSVFEWRSVLQQHIDALSAGADLNPDDYKLQEYDFSQFQKLKAYQEGDEP